MEDDLSQIFDRSKHIFAALGGCSRSLHPRPSVQRLQLSLDALELAGRNSASGLKGAITTYRINSFRRLCSSTSPGSVAKSASSVAICGRRFSILFPTGTASCGCIGQRRVLSRGSRANFVIGINGGDDPQGSFEGTEPICGLLWNVNGNRGSSKRGVPPGSLQN